MRTTTFAPAKHVRPAMLLTDIGAVATRLWKSYRNHVRWRATERALAGLSDGALRDIGLHRSEISSAARQVTSDRRHRD